MVFIPTYLYIKQHSITGKLYFGKTVENPETYLGSGKHWKSHIKVHGKEHVETLWYCMFLDKESIQEFALNFSKHERIVESNQWLNLKNEDGLDGGWAKGYATAKDFEGNTFSVMTNDSRLLSGELGGINAHGYMLTSPAGIKYKSMRIQMLFKTLGFSFRTTFPKLSINESYSFARLTYKILNGWMLTRIC